MRLPCDGHRLRWRGRTHPPGLRSGRLPATPALGAAARADARHEGASSPRSVCCALLECLFALAEAERLVTEEELPAAGALRQGHRLEAAAEGLAGADLRHGVVDLHVGHDLAALAEDVD